MGNGSGGARRRRSWFQSRGAAQCAAIVAGLLIAGVSSRPGGHDHLGARWHSWSDVQAAVTGSVPIPFRCSDSPGRPRARPCQRQSPIGSAGLAGIVATLALILAMVIVSFAAFFLLGLPALLALVGAGAMGRPGRFRRRSAAASHGWPSRRDSLLALALNTGAACRSTGRFVFGSAVASPPERSVVRLLGALPRLVIRCALFGLVVFALAAG